MPKNVKTKAEAEIILLSMWENGEVPSNFTEDHSEYAEAVNQIMQNGYINMEDFF